MSPAFQGGVGGAVFESAGIVMKQRDRSNRSFPISMRVRWNQAHIAPLVYNWLQHNTQDMVNNILSLLLNKVLTQ